jgi:hypothetical protein
MRAVHSTGRRWAAAASLATVVVAMGLPIGGGVATAAAACTNPPAVFPIDNVTNGQSATGWTVFQGTTPEPFDVTLLGVLYDALGPGRDAILVKASGANIDAIGGMGPGFSGSPVYRNDKLVGSVSYGLGGDAHYGALTPGQDLVNVLMEPTASAAAVPRIALTRGDRRTIARDANVSLAAVSSTLTQIPLPLAVPHIPDARVQRVTDRLTAEGVSVMPYHAGSRSSSATVSSDPIEPGGVFTAAISYGAVPYAAIGTATITCGDYVVAFGHYFTHNGGGVAGAMLDGDVVATIPIGNDYFPFKIANIGTLHGVVDQDRLSGVRGVTGRMPSLTEVTSRITNLDTDAVTTTTTQIARHNYVPWVASDHVYFAIHSALDAHTGSAQATWSVTVRSKGQEYELTLHNAYYGGRALWGPADDLYATLRSLERADGPAHIVSVNVSAQVTERRHVLNVHRARTASTTSPTFDVRETIDVHPGDVLSVRVPLQESRTGDVIVAETTFTIPADARGDGSLFAGTTRTSFWVRGTSLTDTIEKLLASPTSEDLQLQLRLRGAHRQTQYLPQTLPVAGSDDVDVRVLRS